MPPARFEGFPPDARRFLRALAKNNNRSWFNSHKARYLTSVVEPMCGFIAAMQPHMAKFADAFVVDPRPHRGSMFRIYRDVRFAKDKRPYKEYASCQFRHGAGKDVHAPGFYIHVAPDDVFFGGGLWTPPSGPLGDVRQAIVDDPEGWKKVSRGAAFKKRFGGLQGESLKRAPRGFDAEHPLIDDLKRKSFFAMQTVDAAEIEKPTFVKTVAASLKASAPLMEFLCDALEVNFHGER